jgi:hypothetical protein|tara:strand:- start:432 stop:1214 length:783 start_codon:yes stop_codon:yes gene_type:complete
VIAAIDFSRSFLWWRIDTDKVPPGTITVPPPYALNNARMPLDCLCTIEGAGAVRSFALGASCKTEAVGAERDIWPQPNADFIQVLSDDGEALGIKTYEVADRQIPLHLPELGLQPEHQVCRVADVFESARTDVTRVDAEPLTTAPAAVEAILTNRRLVARTSWREAEHDVVLDYPVKTVNANERDTVFQPDTGPVLVPDPALPPAGWIQGLQLAFIAFNRFDWAELLIREPVSVAEAVSTWHYTRPRRVECTNELFALIA